MFNSNFENAYNFVNCSKDRNLLDNATLILEANKSSHYFTDHSVILRESGINGMYYLYFGSESDNAYYSITVGVDRLKQLAKFFDTAAKYVEMRNGK